MDILAEKYYSISPYVYVANNPMKFIDPTGMEMDDYFNRQGFFLGTDNSSTDNVRVMDSGVWNMNKNYDGSIDPEIGTESSSLVSESQITDQAALNIYNHYNPTDLP